ncbi:4-hydroxyphenylpyruvate dioxygenase [Nocardia brasiliensis]|uniref:4-hydroxyphenylpyruvate dioxygenase n=1 Tax=Nocardia brasiliensis TaxID=37326 RepID=UPI0024583498|nr:4-hydroxyphenylpyruvate dioxygenase [Nocardia brasiliensis]
MNDELPVALTGLTVNHVEFYVDDLSAHTTELADGYGFTVAGVTDPAATGADSGSLALRQRDITLMLTEGYTAAHPATGYVAAHGAGVADIALATADAGAAFAAAVARGARPVLEPVVYPGTDSVIATIGAFGDVVHTFVEHGPSAAHRLPPGLRIVAPLAHSEPDTRLATLDHIAVCVEPGRLEPTVEFYREVLGFRAIYEERVVIGAQAMLSTVVQNDCGTVTLVLVEPEDATAPGQLNTFLRDHGGPGIQHLAFSTDDIVTSVAALRGRGIECLRTPATYYTLLVDRLEPDSYTVSQLQELDILVDEDHDGQLFQIFTRSTHPRGTYFSEIIQRRGARTFGSGNIKALYTAVELDHANQRASAR